LGVTILEAFQKSSSITLEFNKRWQHCKNI
jgi:hypothetical protein